MKDFINFTYFLTAQLKEIMVWECTPQFMFFFIILAQLFGHAKSHGRLIEPPSRTSAWRFGFSTPTYYNDTETNCGGYDRHRNQNGGKCGICGDAWDERRPRKGEGGGRFGTGVIVRKFRPGERIKISVDITANHLGYFQFRLCPHNNPRRPAFQSCLDRHLLRWGGEGGGRVLAGQQFVVLD